MSLFYFHVDDGVFVPDLDGTDLADIDEARTAAVDVSGQMLRDRRAGFWKDGRRWRMHVTDAAGHLLFTLHFSADEPSEKVLFRPVAEARVQPG